MRFLGKYFGVTKSYPRRVESASSMELAVSLCELTGNFYLIFSRPGVVENPQAGKRLQVIPERDRPRL